MKSKCLYCYKELLNNEIDFHTNCSFKFFGNKTALKVNFSESELERLALDYIKINSNITGVQPKLSLNLDIESKKFTIAGLWGNYILKPQSDFYNSLPEVEDLTMHLAELSGIKTVPHSLIRMASGNLAYITKRIDRDNGNKIGMEDMCQLSGKLTEEKYNGSYEQIAKLISKYSSFPGLDIINFAEIILFSFITGNADMHLKNFSIIDDKKLSYTLAPAYDLVATKLVNKLDNEDTALTLNGKKRKINKNDFIVGFSNCGLNTTQIEKIFMKYKNLVKNYLKFIELGFISEELKEEFKSLINEKSEILFN